MFWLLQLQSAALTYQRECNLEKFPRLSDFGEVLLRSPHLMDSTLWRKHYTKGLLFGLEARGKWCWPDLDPLPVSADQLTCLEEPQPADPAGRLPRLAFIVVQKVDDPSTQRRGEHVKRALEAIKVAIMRDRAANPDVPPFSLTQAYFWIQILHYARFSLGEDVSVRVPDMAFEAFLELTQLGEDEWTKYYSRRLWDSVTSRIEFSQPDLEPLPSVLVAPPTGRSVLARSEKLDPTATINEYSSRRRLPPDDELTVMAAILVGKVSDLRKAPSPVIATHAELLEYLHNKLVRRRQHGEEKPTGPPEAIAEALDISGPYLTSAESKSFWVREVLAADAKDPALFIEDFFTRNAHLAYEQLPLVYFSSEVTADSDLWSVVDFEIAKEG